MAPRRAAGRIGTGKAFRCPNVNWLPTVGGEPVVTSVPGIEVTQRPSPCIAISGP